LQDNKRKLITYLQLHQITQKPIILCINMQYHAQLIFSMSYITLHFVSMISFK